MALQTLSKTGITNNSTIQAWHVSQSIDAFTGDVGYAITLSGSLNLTGSTITGSTANITSITGSLKGTADTGSVAQSVKVTNNATTNQSYRLLFVAESGLPDPNDNGYAQPRFDSGSDGSGLYYNPSTNTLNLQRVSGSNDGTLDFFGTASYAQSSSIAEFANNVSNFTPSFVGIDDDTYATSTPYIVNNTTPNNIYVSQSAGNTLGLTFTSAGVTSGKQITFGGSWKNTTLDGNFIAITASTNVYGISGNSISSGNQNTISAGLGVNNFSSITFQYISTVTPIFPTAGWYVASLNQN